MDSEVMITNWGGLSGRFLNLLMSGDMFDIQLQVGARLFEAHKLILSASSDVFKTMFTDCKWSEAHKETIELVEEPVCESVFDRFIHYIYTGQLYLSHRTVCPLLTLADKYNVKELIPLCRKYMIENLEARLLESCVLQWWRVANLRNDSELESKILNYTELNFNTIIESPDFLHASIQTVEKLISSSRLVVCNELTILCGIQQWVETFMECNPSLLEAKAAFVKLISHVRWRLLTVDEIEWLKNSNSIKNFMSKLSFQFSSNPSMPCFISVIESTNLSNNLSNEHDPWSFSNLNSIFPESTPANFNPLDIINKTSQQDVHSSVSTNQNLPRVYISDYWATELTIQDFSSFPQYGMQIFLFSSPKTGFIEDDGLNLDWEVELYPKGVHFPPAIMIGLDRDGSKLIEELFVNTVRLSVMSRSPHEIPLKVEVNILVRANSSLEPGSTFFEQCHTRTCFFEHESQRHNFDDLIPSESLGMYLQPHSPMPEMFLTPTVAFSLCVVIRPLPVL